MIGESLFDKFKNRTRVDFHAGAVFFLCGRRFKKSHRPIPFFTLFPFWSGKACARFGFVDQSARRQHYIRVDRRRVGSHIVRPTTQNKYRALKRTVLFAIHYNYPLIYSLYHTLVLSTVSHALDMIIAAVGENNTKKQKGLAFFRGNSKSFLFTMIEN